MTSKTILFLTYYFYPCNYVAANRPNSFTKNLVKHGYSVTIVTRHWTGKEKIWSDYLKSDDTPLQIIREAGKEVHYLPYKDVRYPSKFLSTVNTVWQNVTGNFNYEINFNQFLGYAETLMNKQSFDYVLLSIPPLTVLKCGSFLARKYKIPMIVDVRDFENDILLYRKKKQSWFRRLQHKLLMLHFKKWVNHDVIICTVSPPLTDYISSSTGKNALTLTNGFNEELLIVDEPQSKDWFTITVTGTLYEFANIGVMLETCKMVISRHSEVKIKFQFIGLMANESVARMFNEIIPPQNLVLTHRVPQPEAMQLASASHVLMLAGFDDMKGAYTTKIFEYLGLRRNIIQIPGDRDVVEELIKDTEAGKAPHTSEEAYSNIMQWYTEWVETKHLKYFGNIERIIRYSREKQFEKLLKRLQR